jgi:transposase
VGFTEEPGVNPIVWLFSKVLGYSRLIWARFVIHQDLQSVLRCHFAALETIGGASRENLYDRMTTAVIAKVRTADSSTWPARAAVPYM